MNKHKYLSKILKKFKQIIDSLIIKNSKLFNIKEKKDKKLDYLSAKRVLAAVFLILILIFSYLSIPILYNKSELQSEIKNQLLKKYDMQFVFASDMKYGLFPRPSFTFTDVKILNLDKNIDFAEIKKLKINLFIKNFFSLKSLKIKDIFLNNVNFNVKKNDISFFNNLLDSNFMNTSIKIEDSFIFFTNQEDEILFINKINKMKYYHDPKRKFNILSAENEIFNIPYSFDLINDKTNKKILSTVNLNILKSLFEGEHNYKEDINNGSVKIISKNNKSLINYKLNQNIFSFEFNDSKLAPEFYYTGQIDLKPFFLNLLGKAENINISSLIDPNSLLIQLLKTEIFNNQNLNVTSTLNAKLISPYQKIVNLIFNIKIKEGLIDLDNTNFSWSDFADFEISDSLVYLSENNLTLDGVLKIDIKNYNEIYKFFQTPRNHRKEIRKIEFEFNYNFDQEIINISNLKINNILDENVGKILNRLVSQDNVLQNRIYIKNLINKAIKSYAG